MEMFVNNLPESMPVEIVEERLVESMDIVEKNNNFYANMFKGLLNKLDSLEARAAGRFKMIFVVAIHRVDGCHILIG